jgi:hypothetical protein
MQNHVCNGDKNTQDPVCKGEIYYTFGWTPQNQDPNNYVTFADGSFIAGTTQSVLVVKFNTLASEQRELAFNYPNFFVGYRIYNVIGGVLSQFRTVTSYNPATDTITIDRPFTDTLVLNSVPDGFALFSILPETWSIYIPTVDNNNNVIKKIPLYYNGYYVVFESPNPNYSNSSNSNIFYRRISYYDYETQLAYFDKPLPFDYFGPNLPDSEQTWTLRKNLPLERWRLDKTTYFKNTYPTNPIIGPLQGYVLTLPPDASSVNNYYKGKYIYVVSNAAQSYSPPLPPQSVIYPIKGAFFPIYGLFYIRAYNGQTKECSIECVENKLNITDEYSISNNSDIPTYLPLDNINGGSFIPSIGVTSITESGGVYKANIDPTILPDSGGYYNITLILPLKRKKTYHITWNIRQSPIMDPSTSYFVTSGGTYRFYSYDKNPTVYIESTYNTFEFDMTMKSDIDFLTFDLQFKTSDILNSYFEWDLLTVEQFDIINIVELNYDSYAPLDYNGTMVSAQEAVCYQMSILGLTLPNRQLLTGSIIAFYPFLYVQIENVTSPTKVANNVIISNNPPSSKAVFVLEVPQVSNPDVQQFVTLGGGGTQIIKFKPNDNLRFSVYLSDGSPFQTLLPDNLPPYPPDPTLQVHVVFSIERVTQ